MGVGKLLAPIGLAVLGLGAGVGAGMALKPEPPEAAADAHGAAPPVHCEEGAHCEAAAQPPDPFDPNAAPKPKPKPEGETANVPFEKPFVVPVFRKDKVAAMIVASIAIDLPAEDASKLEAVQPRLRDGFLAAMFRHSNSGGFDGAFTEGRKVEDLRSALLAAAQEVLGEDHVHDVLITEMLRQDM